MVGTVVPAVVGAVLGAALSPVLSNAVAQAVKLLEKNHELWKGFYYDIDFIEKELGMIAATEKDQLLGKGDPSAVKTKSMEEMRNLLYDIEDCLDRILCHSECHGADGGMKFATDVEELKKRLMDARQRPKVNGSQPACDAAASSTSAANTAGPTMVVEAVGIDEPKEELRELLEGHQEELNVISIVGFSGSGKTTLATEVFNDVAAQFDCRALVAASKHEDHATLLMALQTELLKEDPPSGDVQTNIKNFLSIKRYLVVLDDIEEQQWRHIRSIFPNKKTRSRILVTTTIQEVAELCRNHGNNGYVYNMRTLDENHSKDLLDAVLMKRIPGLDQSSSLIVKKCDGHPLALATVAEYLLMSRVQFTETDCKDFWVDIGHVMKEKCFSKLQKVLTNNYNSLPSHFLNLKTCLLYMCVFPNGHPIRRNRLIRRWLAEGYVEDPDPCKALRIADKNLEKLIDRNIIRPIDPGKKAKVKTCRAHGIMHEFMLHMSMSTTSKFIASLGNPRRNNYRHLFIDPRPSSGSASNVNHHHTRPVHGDKSGDEKIKKPRAHSLTICGCAGEDFSHFAKCELLRVLDLEDCNDLEDKHLDTIHELWHLKYLSLGAKISRLPNEIEKLHCLEMLDMRKTKTEITLPVEVLKLPHLGHLLGKFKLVGKSNWEKPELDKFLKQESSLQVLAGFVTDDNPGFPMLMVHMKKLRKVKVWCDSTSSMSFSALLTAIKIFVRALLDTGYGDHSLSLYLGNSAEDILRPLGEDLSRNHFLENSEEIPSGYLRYLKLHGELKGLTQFATSLVGLKELCLSSTNDLTSDELTNLRKLERLEYLKLVNVSFGDFIIRSKDFRRLLRLCLVQCPSLPTIEEEALPNLLSLRLLNKVLVGLSGIEIKRHKLLRELALDTEVKQETKKAWEDAAKKHPKRPRILYLKRVDPDGTGSMVKYVAAERPAHDTGSSVVREELQIPAAQSIISAEELSSALNNVTVGPYMASIELSSAMNNDRPSSSRAMP